MLTVSFVMLAELLIFIPSIAKYRVDFLTERLMMGRLAGIGAVAADPDAYTPAFEARLLSNADVLSVAILRDDRRLMMLRSPNYKMPTATYDLDQAGTPTLILDALMVIFSTEDRNIQVSGTARFEGGDRVEVVVREPRLRAAMLQFAWRIFLLSLIISAITATLVYFAVRLFLLRPIERMVASIVSFREDPEDADRIMQPTGAGGEIGRAEAELAETQREVRAALQQKSRLAALGEAVAKINHDLRNILAHAQLMADRLEASRDPLVARVGPKLIGSLDRAIRLCKETLAFGKASEPPPQRTGVRLAALVDELGTMLGVGPVALREVPAAAGEQDGDPPEPETAVRLENRVPRDMLIDADPDQLHRALLNLTRNAVQALEGRGGGVIAIEARQLRLTAGHDGGGEVVEIDVVDNGPGLPKQTRKDLFKPFKTSTKRGGSGLGLAIAAELVRGHGGALDLVESSDAGTRFRLSLPQLARKAVA